MSKVGDSKRDHQVVKGDGRRIIIRAKEGQRAKAIGKKGVEVSPGKAQAQVGLGRNGKNERWGQKGGDVQHQGPGQDLRTKRGVIESLRNKKKKKREKKKNHMALKICRDNEKNPVCGERTKMTKKKKKKWDRKRDYPFLFPTREKTGRCYEKKDEEGKKKQRKMGNKCWVRHRKRAKKLANRQGGKEGGGRRGGKKGAKAAEGSQSEVGQKDKKGTEYYKNTLKQPKVTLTPTLLSKQSAESTTSDITAKRNTFHKPRRDTKRKPSRLHSPLVKNHDYKSVGPDRPARTTQIGLAKSRQVRLREGEVKTTPLLGRGTCRTRHERKRGAKKCSTDSRKGRGGEGTTPLKW